MIPSNAERQFLVTQPSLTRNPTKSEQFKQTCSDVLQFSLSAENQWKNRQVENKERRNILHKIFKNFKVKTLLFNLQTKFSVSSLPCSKRALNLAFSSVALIGDKITITEPK